VAYIYSRLQQLISRGDDLPTLPGIILQLDQVLDDPTAGTAQVARVIEQDPALTREVLRIANSQKFRRSGARIRSVPMAVLRMGLDHVRSVCMVHAVVQAFDHGRARTDRRRFWSHCATVASLASWLWARVGDTRAIRPEDAYVVGLLHDVGLLVIDRHFPDEFSDLLEAREDPDAALAPLEEELLGLDHGAVAGFLIGRWSLPSFVADAIAQHNHPADAPPEIARLATVLATAEAMCWQLDLGLPIEGRPVLPAAQLLRALDVPASEVSEMIDWTWDAHDFATECLS